MEKLRLQWKILSCSCHLRVCEDAAAAEDEEGEQVVAAIAPAPHAQLYLPDPVGAATT